MPFGPSLALGLVNLLVLVTSGDLTIHLIVTTAATRVGGCGGGSPARDFYQRFFATANARFALVRTIPRITSALAWRFRSLHPCRLGKANR